jgi:hypothetical protein
MLEISMRGRKWNLCQHWQTFRLLNRRRHGLRQGRPSSQWTHAPKSPGLPAPRMPPSGGIAGRIVGRLFDLADGVRRLARDAQRRARD